MNDTRLTNFLSTNAIQRAYLRGFRDAITGPIQPTNYAPIINSNFNALVANGVKKNSGTNMGVALSTADLTTAPTGSTRGERI
jgi:hypothetical protein